MVQVRLAALSVAVALRSLGPVPWVLAAIYVLAACLQEPVALRASDIYLGPQSVESASAILLLLLGSQLRLVRRAATHLLAVLFMTAAVSVLPWGMLAAIERATPSPYPAVGGGHTALTFIANYFPTTACISLVSDRANLPSILHCLVQLMIAFDAAQAEACSASQIVARIACGTAAWIATSCRCAQHA